MTKTVKHVWFCYMKRLILEPNKRIRFKKTTKGKMERERWKQRRVLNEAERREHCFLVGEEELSSLEPRFLV